MLVAGSSYAQTTPQKDQKDRKARTELQGARAEKVRKSPEEMARMKTERLSQKLDLNATQKNQLQALNLRQAEEMKAMRERYKGTEDKAQLREAKKASHDKWQAELKSILTEKQYTQYEADRVEMHHKRGEGKSGHKSQKSGEMKKQGT
ncbi:hypothetical protein OB13_11885 [Pontibacter sp. HJ8]